MRIIARATLGMFPLAFCPLTPSQTTTPNCGYEDRNPIEPATLKVSAIRGTAIDPASVPVSQAQVFLFSGQEHSLVTRTQTDTEGRFALTKINNGKYRLVVKAAGFCPANVPLMVVPGKHDRKLVLHMRIGEIDVCSHGDLE